LAAGAGLGGGVGLVFALYWGACFICDYSAEITETGQTDSQEPQSMQASPISYLVSPSVMQETGQTDAQEPHLMQPSAITLIIRTSIKI